MRKIFCCSNGNPLADARSRLDEYVVRDGDGHNSPTTFRTTQGFTDDRIAHSLPVASICVRFFFCFLYFKILSVLLVYGTVYESPLIRGLR